jgi:hypothetical protein
MSDVISVLSSRTVADELFVLDKIFPMLLQSHVSSFNGWLLIPTDASSQ